ncbi:MAG TPA: GDSL-type esterase/lipase family protein [Thermoleophilaceae bacterium]|nr:GDSL-type esterase/lipase family protein [Thermoleophilaceae bacterium]
MSEPYYPTSPEPAVPPAPSGRRLSARHAVIVVLLAALLLVLLEGSSVRSAGEEMDPGLARELTLAIGKPTGWVADRLPFDDWTDDALAVLEDEGAGTAGGFGSASATGGSGRGVPPVPPDSFDPAELGAAVPPAPKLRKLLVTGDSLAMPLDAEIARRLAGGDAEVERDPHVGTGISKTGLVDWGKLSTQQAREREPDAVVVFIGANEGFDLPGPGGRQLKCCGPEWAAGYAYRARRMMNTYRRGGRARVYWLTLPAPRDADRREIARAVNAAIEVAAQPYRAQVRVLDMEAIFTPGGRYRDAMEVEGRRQIVREPDGIHLNGRGAQIAADAVLEAVRRDFAVEP